jgi:hypothetical protein
MTPGLPLALYAGQLLDSCCMTSVLLYAPHAGQLLESCCVTHVLLRAPLGPPTAASLPRSLPRMHALCCTPSRPARQARRPRRTSQEPGARGRACCPNPILVHQVPLDNGTDDATFHRLFKPIMEKVVQVFQPGAVVLQCGAPRPGPQPRALCMPRQHERLSCCVGTAVPRLHAACHSYLVCRALSPTPGADSLANDRLGCFNLTLDGHAEAVKYMKRFGLPLLVTGGARPRGGPPAGPGASGRRRCRPLLAVGGARARGTPSAGTAARPHSGQGRREARAAQAAATPRATWRAAGRTRRPRWSGARCRRSCRPTRTWSTTARTTGSTCTRARPWTTATAAPSWSASAARCWRTCGTSRTRPVRRPSPRPPAARALCCCAAPRMCASADSGSMHAQAGAKRRRARRRLVRALSLSNSADACPGRH